MAEASRVAVAYLGIDVGKRSRSAYALDEAGAVVFRADLENRPAGIDRLLERAGGGADSLAGNEVYEYPLTVPGIGPETAAALVTSVDISMFRGHDQLASCCGLAPADSRSGTSVRSVSPQRGGNRQLKNLLIFSCNSLIGTGNGFGRHCDGCRARGMRHSKALKAVARKRLKVIYAVMRDAAPYSA